MDVEINLQSKNNLARKIEDIIDIQKANGSINVRQVAFKLPLDKNSNSSDIYTKSLDIDFSETKSDKAKLRKKKAKNGRKKYVKTTSDVLSWPSDSDITVLRLKLDNNVAKDKMNNVLLGDGLHQPDSSSMVNLATLMLQSQAPSKHCLNVEEYLLPLNSWENAKSSTICSREFQQPVVEISNSLEKTITEQGFENQGNRKNRLSYNGNEFRSETTIKSKVARFLRLYFCPCCTCLYNLETTQGKQKHNYE